MTGNHRWRIRLTPAANGDLRKIVLWTVEKSIQARACAETLTRSIEALAAGPRIAGSRNRDDIAEGLMTLHDARQERRGRHLILYRIGTPDDPPATNVLRPLHDSMDLSRLLHS